MSVLDGVSECWWLSSTCVVNWNAWAAVGTVAAVFAAVFAPTIQRAFVRRKANALFALTFRGDVINVLIRLKSLRVDYPMTDRDRAAWAVEQLLSQDASKREDFLARARYLDILSKREIDLTKWTAADLELAAKIAVAMESVRHFQLGAQILGHPSEVEDWDAMLQNMARVIDQAIEDVTTADEAIEAAVKAIRRSGGKVKQTEAGLLML